jgi:hypothetical protein
MIAIVDPGKADVVMVGEGFMPPLWQVLIAPNPKAGLIEGLDLVPVVPSNHQDAGARCERRHDLAGQAEDRGLVCRTVAYDQGATAVGQSVEDAAECGAQPLRVVRDERSVGFA